MAKVLGANNTTNCKGYKVYLARMIEIENIVAIVYKVSIKMSNNYVVPSLQNLNNHYYGEQSTLLVPKHA